LAILRGGKNYFFERRKAVKKPPARTVSKPARPIKISEFMVNSFLRFLEGKVFFH
jgi:hypothetical protein